jgi:hypothetical protein
VCNEELSFPARLELSMISRMVLSNLFDLKHFGHCFQLWSIAFLDERARNKCRSIGSDADCCFGKSNFWITKISIKEDRLYSRESCLYSNTSFNRSPMSPQVWVGLTRGPDYPALCKLAQPANPFMYGIFDPLNWSFSRAHIYLNMFIPSAFFSQLLTVLFPGGGLYSLAK